jgi:hypothetical protein
MNKLEKISKINFLKTKINKVHQITASIEDKKNNEES